MSQLQKTIQKNQISFDFQGCLRMQNVRTYLGFKPRRLFENVCLSRLYFNKILASG